MRLQNRAITLLLLAVMLVVTTISLGAASLDANDPNPPDIPTADGTISFNINDTATIIDQRVLGTNLPAWLGAWRTENNTFIARTNAAQPTVIRVPGGSWSNWYDWSNCEMNDVCPWDWGVLTPTDFINFLQETGAEGMFTINHNGTSKEAAAAVAFFNGSVTDDTVIGVDINGKDWGRVSDWAQLRSNNGNPNPINIKYWEIGNEIYGGKPGSGKDCLDWGWEDVWSCDGVEYVNGISGHEGYIAFRNEMRRIDPTIMVGAVGIPWGNSSEFWINYNNWGNEVIEEAGDVMDFYVIHQYAYTNPPGNRQDALAQPQSTWEPIMDDLNTSFDLYANGRRVPIAVTEYNMFAVEDNDTGQWMTQAVNMLFMADTMGQMMENGFAIANQWDLANGQAWNGTDYGMLNADNYSRSPQYYAFPLWAEFGSQMLPVTTSFNEAATLSVYAGKIDPATVTVLAINKTGSVQTADIQIDGAGQISGGTANVVQSTSLDSQSVTYNGVSNPADDLSNAPPTTIPGGSNPLAYTFAPYSVTLLHLQLGDVTSQLAVNDVTVTEGDSGTTNAAFTVSLSPASSETVTVDYATNDGTAVAGSDYTAVNSTLTFNPGQTTKTVNVSVNGDNVQETDETFTLDLSGAVNADISDSQGLATILDDDTPSLTITDAATNEGDSGTTNIVFTINLSEASSQTVTVNYATAHGTATENIDYVGQSNQKTFTPGQTNQTITVTVNGDTTVEANETFTVALSNANNAIIADANGTGTIMDDDATEWVYLPLIVR